MARWGRVLTAGVVVLAVGLGGCSSSSDKAKTDTGSSSSAAVATDTGSTDTSVASDDTSDTGSSSDTGGSSGHSYVDGSKVTDAAAWVKDLLVAGKTVTSDDLSDPDAYGKAFQKAFPDVLADAQFVGYGVEAPKNGLSGYQPISPKSPSGIDSALGFTVKDDTGTCAGGLILIKSDGKVETKSVDVSGGCTGQAVLDAENIS